MITSGICEDCGRERLLALDRNEGNTLLCAPCSRRAQIGRDGSEYLLRKRGLEVEAS